MSLARGFRLVTFSPIQTFLRPTALHSRTLHSSHLTPPPVSNNNPRPNIEQALDDMKLGLGHRTSSTDLDLDPSQNHNAHAFAHQTSQDLLLAKTTVRYSSTSWSPSSTNNARSSADTSQDLFAKTAIAMQRLKNSPSETFEDDINLSVQREVGRSLESEAGAAPPVGIENMARTVSDELKRTESVPEPEEEEAIRTKQRMLLADDDVEGSAETAVAAFWGKKVVSSEEGYKFNEIDVDAGNEERPAGFTDLYKDGK